MKTLNQHNSSIQIVCNREFRHFLQKNTKHRGDCLPVPLVLTMHNVLSTLKWRNLGREWVITNAGLCISFVCLVWPLFGINLPFCGRLFIKARNVSHFDTFIHFSIVFSSFSFSSFYLQGEHVLPRGGALACCCVRVSRLRP